MQTSFISLISKYRSFIMGIAILWIGIYHIPLRTQIPVLHFINDSGYGGVDFFIFLSGFGLYYSLKKTDDNGKLDIYAYIKRRALRLLPSYIPFIIVWMIVKKISHRIYITEIFGNLTWSGWWNGDENQFNWYIDLLLLIYIIAPIIYSIITRVSKQFTAIILMFIFVIMVGIAFFHGQLIQAMSRLPIFVLGMSLPSLSDSSNVPENSADTTNKKITHLLFSKWVWIVLSVLGVALLVLCRFQTLLDCWHYGLYWYPFFLIVPGITILLCALARVLDKRKFGSLIVRGISELGKASFEIFLFHLGVFEFFQLKGTYNLNFWIPTYIISFAVGYVYYRLVNRVRKHFT